MQSGENRSGDGAEVEPAPAKERETLRAFFSPGMRVCLPDLEVDGVVWGVHFARAGVVSYGVEYVADGGKFVDVWLQAPRLSRPVVEAMPCPEEFELEVEYGIDAPVAIPSLNACGFVESIRVDRGAVVKYEVEYADSSGRLVKSELLGSRLKPSGAFPAIRRALGLDAAPNQEPYDQLAKDLAGVSYASSLEERTVPGRAVVADPSGGNVEVGVGRVLTLSIDGEDPVELETDAVNEARSLRAVLATLAESSPRYAAAYRSTSALLASLLLCREGLNAAGEPLGE